MVLSGDRSTWLSNLDFSPTRSTECIKRIVCTGEVLVILWTWLQVWSITCEKFKRCHRLSRTPLRALVFSADCRRIAGCLPSEDATLRCASLSANRKANKSGHTGAVGRCPLESIQPGYYPITWFKLIAFKSMPFKSMPFRSIPFKSILSRLLPLDSIVRR